MAGASNTQGPTCAQCGGEVVRTGRHAPKIYCSRRCNLAAWKVRNPEQHRANICKEADKNRQASALRRSQKVVAPKAPRAKHCRTCGQVVDKHAQRCAKCREMAKDQTKIRNRSSEAGRAARRRAKAWRRAIERAPHAERFDPFEVFERDKWRCHLCGVSTPERLRGGYDDRAPELDHIVPLSAGGEHSRRNTACACRRCNNAKGGRPLGQMWLIA